MSPAKKVSVRLKPRGKPHVVPVRIPPVPYRGWLQSGGQTHRTKAIVKFASGFSGDPVSVVRNALESVCSFREVPLNLDQLGRVYARRTADEIVRSKAIAVSDESAKKDGLTCLGCVDSAVALAAVLRARGIPCAFTREIEHSAVLFFDGNRLWKADPVLNLVEPVKTSRLQWMNRQMKRPVKDRSFAIGLDAWDIGIRSLADFNRYCR